MSTTHRPDCPRYGWGEHPAMARHCTCPRYVTRPRPSLPWADAGDIRLALEAAGFRYSELVAHIADLDAGHTLTDESGREFRRAEVAPSPNHPTVDLPADHEGPRLPTTYRPDAEWARDVR